MKHPEICFNATKTRTIIPIKVYKKTVVPELGHTITRKVPADDNGYSYYNQKCETMPTMHEVLVSGIIPPNTNVKVENDNKDNLTNNLSCEKVFVKNQQFLKSECESPHVSYSFSGCVDTIKQSG